MTLNDIQPGKRVIIKKITTSGPIKKKLMDMGLTRHTEVLVRKVAPLGDPMELTVRGYELSIRKNDAAAIEVE